MSRTASDQYSAYFKRNEGIITAEEQSVLKKSTIAVAGLGGVGGAQVVALARAGVGSFKIADPEVFNKSDHNRQYGAMESTNNKNKAQVMRDIILDINPHCKVEIFKEGVNNKNVKKFVEKADVIVDAIEYFSLDEKRFLYKSARLNKKYVFSCPIIGFGASLLVFKPNGLSFEKYFDLERTRKLTVEKLCPIYPDYLSKKIYEDAVRRKRAVPSISTAATLSGALLANEVILYLLKRSIPISIPEIIQIDLFNKKIETVKGEWSGFWSDFADEAYGDICRLTEYRKMILKIVKWVGKNQKVLDAGCGTGYLTKHLIKQNDVTAIDFSKGMLRRTKVLVGASKKVKILLGNVLDLKFANSEFDVVTSVNVFFNLDNPYRAIQEANRVLKMGGRFIVSSLMESKGLSDKIGRLFQTDCKKNKVAEKTMRKIWEFQTKMLNDGGFKFKPTIKKFCGMLEENGFKIEKSEVAYFSSNYLVSAKKVRDL